MKIGIIIPLKAKVIAKDWDIVEQSLLNTLLSVVKQSDDRFHVCVVGHDCPSYLNNKIEKLQNVSFVQFADFPPPILGDNNADNQEKFEIDRTAKIQAGYNFLNDKEHDLTHAFPLDADDLVHYKLVEKLSKFGESNFIIDNGYIYYAQSKVLNKTKAFSTFCGSSSILTTKFINENMESGNTFIFKKVGHVHMKDYLSSNNVPFVVPNERLLMYVRDNGENISRLGKLSYFYDIKRNLKKWICALPNKSAILRQFGVK